MVSIEDKNELKRMLTNLYADDKACIRRVIKGIADLERANISLRGEVENLKK